MNLLAMCAGEGRQAHLAGVVLNLFARRPTGRGRLATSRERDAGHLPPPNARNADGRATGCRPIPSWGPPHVARLKCR